MHDIWNPWHGCKKISEGCDHCYMYFLDKKMVEMEEKFTGQKETLLIPCKKIDRVIIK